MPRHSPDEKFLWLIAADRGGTFTDCCARDPSDGWHRAKLLSSGRLRAAVRSVAGSTLEPGTDWNQSAGFFENWTAELFAPGAPSAPSWSGKVLGSGSHGMNVSPALPAAATAGWTLELYTGEAAPVVGARLLTGTKLGRGISAPDASAWRPLWRPMPCWKTRARRWRFL